MQPPEHDGAAMDKEPEGEHDMNMVVVIGPDVGSGLEKAGHLMKKLVATGEADALEGAQFTAPVIARTVLEHFTPVFVAELRRRLKSGVPKRTKRLKVSRPKGH